MIPERDYFLARAEVRRRREEAADERAARDARRAARAQVTQARRDSNDARPAGALGWLRRLAGARH